MEAIAKLVNIPTSPRKMRLVVDLVRGMEVTKALNLLKFQPQHASQTVERVLLTAIANWQVKNVETNLEDANLVVKEIFVDAGSMLKRLSPAPQGRGHRIRKRSNHLTIKIDSVDITISAK